MNELERLKQAAAHDGIDRIVVAVLVQHGGKILLLQRMADDFMPGIHEFPGGVVERDEALAAAIARELLEETGLQAGDIAGYLGHFEYVSGSGRRTRQLNFVVQVAEVGEIVHPEHQAAAWVGPDEAHGYRLTDESRQVLARYFAQSGSVSGRTERGV